MQITNLRIDRFGLWNDLDLALNGGGVSVIAGPNETGKSTLLRFLRGVLYGFGNEPAGIGGSVELRHKGRHCNVERHRMTDGRESLSVEGFHRLGPDDEILRELVAGTSRSVFENVFAVGLVELQQLSALHIEETAARLYGVSLGAEGKRLLAALNHTDVAQRTLIDGEHRTGRLVELLAVGERRRSEAESAAERRDQYDRLLVTKRETRERIAELNARRHGMESQLRGHRFMERIWEPWNQVREYQNQLHKLPDCGDIPADGLQRLRAINDELQSERRCRQSVLREIDQLKLRRREARPDAATRRAVAMLNKALAKREQIEADEAALSRAEKAEAVSRSRRDNQLSVLGDGWSAERLQQVDTSASAQQEFLNAARIYQNAQVRRGRFRKQYQKTTQGHNRLRATLAERLKSLNGQSIDDAIEAESARLDNVGRVGELELKEVELKQRRNGIRGSIDEVQKLSLVPAWFIWVLWFFAVAGGLVALIGLFSSATSNLLAGLILCLSGLTGLGMAWGLKHHTDASSRSDIGKKKSRLFDVEHQLAETRKQMAGPSNDDDLQARAKAVAERLASLKQLQRDQDRLDRLNKRCIQLRNRKTTVLQDFGTARANWTDTLNAIGLTETLKLSVAFENWQRVQEANDAFDDWRAKRDEWERLSQLSATRREKIESAARTLKIQFPSDDDLSNQLDICASKLERWNADHPDYSTLKQEYHKRRGEAAEYRDRIRALKREYRDILQSANARNIDDFERLAATAIRKREIEELLAQTQEDLRVAAETEPELAVVEDDLVQFDPEENADCIEALEAELADLQSDLQRAHEELGGLTEAMSRLENEPHASRSRFEAIREASLLRDTTHEWLAGELTRQSLEQLRNRFERDKQPAVLQTASRFFAQLTDDRYARLWAPLGKRSLCADDADGKTWDIESLSGGTREQIFLALRLALVREYAERDVHLPLILDDVLVNFDRARTEAAVETLVDLAADGQQIVFLTCHQHIEEMFARRGIEAVQLPAIHAERQRRIAG